MDIKSHRDLLVWQKATDLVVIVYRGTQQFPKDETYGLTSQVRRAAASVPANVAEGQGRRGAGEYLQFLGNARGPLLEPDTHLEPARRLEYLKPEQHSNFQEKLYEAARLLNGLIRSITNH